MHFETLHAIDTEYSADTVEWCPYDGHREFFVCGTYQLEERQPDATDGVVAKRKGRLHLYSYNRKQDELTLRDTHDTAAILDVKWTRSDAGPMIAAANGLGEVLFYKLSDQGTLVFADRVCLDEAEPGSVLTLAIDWNTDSCADGRQLIASDSLGKLSLLQLDEAGAMRLVSAWPGHSFEAWTCAFDRWQPHVVYSGGDDLMLNVFDTRCANAKVQTNRSHGAGVTTLLSFPDAEHMLASGSYDDQLRVFDTRRFRQPLTELAMGGGVWRIKQNAVRKDLLLCANMYHNFSVVKCDRSLAELSVCAEYFEHKSICYGADWCTLEPERQIGLDDGDAGGEEHIVATCSFYDHKLCIAKVTDGPQQSV